jgi:outer membrane receptor protein involved in Fe transport
MATRLQAGVTLSVPVALAALALAGCPARAQPAPEITIPPVTVIAPSPLLGSGVNRDTIPARTAVLHDSDLTRGGTLPADPVRALAETQNGVNLDSASGNPFQPTLVYHGYQASGLQGVPQGLAVYVNGVRFNQPFGDTVNFDLLPGQAIEAEDLTGSNPVFGLNALGGALSIRLKDGFGFTGAEASLRGGLFGTIAGALQYGKRAADTAVYGAASGLTQQGWRDDQSSAVKNFYGDIGWRGPASELHASVLLATSILNGPGTSPVELLAAAPRAQFTGPNRIANTLTQLSLNGTTELTPVLSLQAVLYYDNFLQRVMNGNAPNDTPCGAVLCSDAGPSTTYGGVGVPAFLGGNPQAYSTLNTQTTNTDGYGASVQATDTETVAGLPNHLVAGVSFDGARTMFTASSTIGGITASRAYIGPGVIIDEPGIDTPVRVGVSDAYYGVFVADTLNVTDRLALTGSARFNLAQIDLGGGNIAGNHAWQRLNPAAGATYKFAEALTVYAGYAEANRAPTPAELSCAGPQDSCSLANFFVGDPNLKQVAAHTLEAGLRGNIDAIGYDLGLFRSVLDDDIVFVNSAALNRAYFTNVGHTRRQGVDASLRYKAPRWSAYLAYTYTDATFQSPFTEAAGNNPAATGTMTIQRGNRLPGIPTHQAKLGVTWRVTDAWTVGGVLVAQTSQVLFGDEANLTPRLPGFVTLNLSTSYQLTENVAVFAYAENVTDVRYNTYGTFAPTSAVFLAQAPNASNPRAYSPAAPFGAFGGVRVTF